MATNTYDFGALRFVFRGTYNASTGYVFNDVVSYAGAVYVFTRTTPGATGVTPSDATPWALMMPAGTALVTGTLANRPTTFTGNRLYIVTGDTAVRNGNAYLDTGTAWVQFSGNSATSVRAVAATTTDLPITVTGLANQTGDLITAYAVPSGGISASTVFRVTPTGRVVTPAESQTLSYNGDGTVATAVRTIGGTTVSSTTFSYNSDGTIASTAETHDGVVDTSTFTYVSGNLTGVARTRA